MMKQIRVLLTACAVGLVTACSTVGPAAQTDSTPASWKLFPDFAAYGMVIVSAPPRDVEDSAEIVLSSTKEASFAYGFTNTTTGKSVSDAIEINREGANTRITVSFPESADYTLALFGKPAGDAGNSYVTLASVSFTARVSAANAAPPNWQTAAAFRKLGVNVTSTPEGTVGEWADILFSTRQEVSVAYYFQNTTTGEDTSAIKNAVETNNDGNNWRVTVYFPKSGDYSLGLFAKTKDEKDYRAIGTVKLSAKVEAPASPPNWTVFPRFRRYGAAIASTPPREVGEEASVVLSLPEGFTCYASVKEAATGKYAGMVASEATEGGRRISVLFPKSGEYELLVTGHPKTETVTRDLAKAAFLAAFDDSAPSYRLWRMEGQWRKLPVGKVTEGTGEWRPLADYMVYEKHATAPLAADLILPVGGGALTVRKGTKITFAASDDSLVEAVSHPLAKDLSVKAGESTITFKAGTDFAVSSYAMAGTLAKDGAIIIDGNAITSPKGSRVVMMDAEPSEIRLAGTGSFTHGARAYLCTGNVIVIGHYGDEIYSSVRITTAKPNAFQFGDTAFTLPAGSLIAFKGDRIDYLGLNKDYDVTVQGEKKTIPAGWGVSFDEKGVMEQFKLE